MTVSCDACKHISRNFCDGYVYKDWSGVYNGGVPPDSDKDKYWTYVECAKNVKKLLYINLDGKCTAFKSK